MAGQPMRRVFEGKIRELGGLTYVLQRIANGDTLKAIAADIGCSRPWLNNWLIRNKERNEAYEMARKQSAPALVERATEALENAPLNRDGLQAAKQLAEHWRWMASRYDRATFGDTPQVQINGGLTLNELHLSALRHRFAGEDELLPPTSKSLPAGIEGETV